MEQVDRCWNKQRTETRNPSTKQELLAEDPSPRKSSGQPCCGSASICLQPSGSRGMCQSWGSRCRLWGADVFLERQPGAAGHAESHQDGCSWAAPCRVTLAVIKTKMLFMLLSPQHFTFYSFVSIMRQVPT